MFVIARRAVMTSSNLGPPLPEWAPHQAVWIGFPSDPDLWLADLKEAEREVAAFAKVVHADGKGEEIWLVAAHDDAAAKARELALVKVSGKGDARVEALRLAEAFRANVIDANTEHFIFEITGKVSKIEQFIAIMKPLGLVEVCRTGVAAMNRGPQGM